VETPRTFRIDRGIGQYDFNDYYAVLGLPLTAESSLVRRRYLLIAKCLHPDIHGRSHSEKQIATQYLSKLVNPAYNVLSQERERTEYSAILKLLGKRLMKRNQKFLPQSDIAQKYLVSSKEVNYEQTIHEIAKVQYQDLGKALEHIGLLSELNLVHILLQEGYKHAPSTPTVSSSPVYTSPSKPASTDDTRIQNTGINTSVNRASSASSTSNTGVNNTGTNRASSAYPNSAGSSYQMRSESQAPLRNNSSTPNTAANAAKNTNQTANNNQASNQNNAADGSLNQYIRQAENFINQKLWASALKELRSAIQLDCNNSKCHALLGFVYMNQKLSGMAKVSFQQALKLNPDEPIARQYIDQVSGTNASGNNAGGNNNQTKTDPKAKNDKKGGFFGWLGGG
jgi:curved DNA-binding protein CbpA